MRRASAKQGRAKSAPKMAAATTEVRTPTATCNRCAKAMYSHDEYSLVDRPGGGRAYDTLCTECWLQAWPGPVKFVFEHGIPAWVEQTMRSKRVLEQLRRWFAWNARGTAHGPKCVVYFVPRATTELLEWQLHWHKGEPWSYRGYCGHGTIVVIVDDKGVETPESIEWITYHELAHHEQQLISRMSDAAWEQELKNLKIDPAEAWKDDKGHEADPEERFVNRVATAFMGGKEYARPWWRARVHALHAGLPAAQFPDPHAP